MTEDLTESLQITHYKILLGQTDRPRLEQTSRSRLEQTSRQYLTDMPLVYMSERPSAEFGSSLSLWNIINFLQCGVAADLQGRGVGQSSSLSVQLWCHDVAALAQPLQLLLLLRLSVAAQFASRQRAFGVRPGCAAPPRLLIVLLSCRTKAFPATRGAQRKRSLSLHHLQNNTGKLTFCYQKCWKLLSAYKYNITRFNKDLINMRVPTGFS